MKKYLLLLLVAVMLLTGGCNFKVEKDTFNIDRDKVDLIEIQREYTDKDGKITYRCKKITDPADLDTMCDFVRTLSVKRASNDKAHPVDAFSFIILVQGSIKHHLVMSEKMAYYDQIAYEYTDEDVYEEIKELYDNLGYEEEDIEPTRFPK